VLTIGLPVDRRSTLTLFVRCGRRSATIASARGDRLLWTFYSFTTCLCGAVGWRKWVVAFAVFIFNAALGERIRLVAAPFGWVLLIDIIYVLPNWRPPGFITNCS
jgi:hypothetical protein